MVPSDEQLEDLLHKMWNTLHVCGKSHKEKEEGSNRKEPLLTSHPSESTVGCIEKEESNLEVSLAMFAEATAENLSQQEVSQV